MKAGRPQDARRLNTHTLAGGILKLRFIFSPVLFKRIWSWTPHIDLIKGHTYLPSSLSLYELEQVQLLFAISFLHELASTQHLWRGTFEELLILTCSVP